MSNEIKKGNSTLLDSIKPQTRNNMPQVGEFVLIPDMYGSPFQYITRIETRENNDGSTEPIIFAKSIDLNWDEKSELDSSEHTLSFGKCDCVFHTLSELRDAYNVAIKNSVQFANSESGEMTEDVTSSELVLSTKDVKQMGVELYSAQAGLERQQALLRAYIRIEQDKLNKMRFAMNDKIEIIKRKVKRFERLVHRIELYSGIEEDVIMLQDGAPAPETEPIYFHQEVLYMDEEVGDWKDQGIDFERIEDFDEWLLRDNHLDLFVSSKGMRVFGVRREEKRGGYVGIGANRVYNPFLKNPLSFDNQKTYIIARNGQRVYRIWADVVIRPLLFPSKNDFRELLNREEWGSPQTQAKAKKEKAEDFVDKYMFNFCLMQGLLDRSDIFSPHPKINLFDNDFSNPAICFVYDAENKQLSNGFEDFWQYVKRINTDITEGSRVIFYAKWAPYKEDRFDKRFQYNSNRRYDDTWGLPDKPLSGLYTLKRRSTGELCIYYNPGDEIWHGGWSWNGYQEKRKCNLSYEVKTGDVSLINYDALTLEALDFYLNNRINRRDYLEIMPLLAHARQELEKEMAMENPFIDMVASSTGCQDREAIEGFVKHWKLKNKVKRPVTSNDTLAFSQICSWIKKARKEDEL